ncbi:flavodoxin [Brachyspira intermedia]|uniref:flavodoxin n=1 Tax=Brachyspira intermedia TaxID=84377 RepID=UPI003003EE23
MKKIKYLIFIIIIICTSCNAQESYIQNKGKILIAYFSIPEGDGIDTVTGASRINNNNRIIGNTEFFAETIKEFTKGELFKIETENKYPNTHQELLEIVQNEIANKNLPNLSKKINNFNEYDIVFVGYPIWYYDLPMAMYSFFEEYDFSNKIIIPFSTHGGSRFSGTIEKIKQLETNAKIVEEGLTISRNDILNSRKIIENWLKNLKL